jgi:hypothetical protein
VASEPKFKTYLCEYGHDGARWCVEVKAASREDAAARLKAMAFARVEGEVVLSGKVPLGGLLRRWFFGSGARG